MSSIEVREFQQSIINFVNSSTLPAEVKRLSLAEVLRQCETAAIEEIKAEAIERNIKEAEGC